MSVIQDVKARKIFDSRGEETIEVEIVTQDGSGRAAAPTGASRGKKEAIPYPEGGVDAAVQKVEKFIAPRLIGADSKRQGEIDFLLRDMDGTGNFKNIGGNTSFAVSLAVADAASHSFRVPLFQYLAKCLTSELPHPLGNVLGGGKHARSRAPDIQEFLALPVRVGSFWKAAETNVLIHKKIGMYLVEKDPTFTGGKTDEGAWSPNLKTEAALDIVTKATEEVSFETEVKCRVGLDIAASSLWNPENKRYVYSRDNITRDRGEQLDFVLNLISKYKLAYIEDPFHEADFRSFSEITKKASDCLICGDDLFVTNKKYLEKGINMGSANATIIKGNQIGTLSEAWKVAQTAHKADYVAVMSHRSGETTDAHIAHLSVAFGCPIIKAGVVGGARTATINELIRIEELLGERAKMATFNIGRTK